MQNKQKILPSSLQPHGFISILIITFLLIFSVSNFPQQKDVLSGFPSFDKLKSNRLVDITETVEDSNLTFLGRFGWGRCLTVGQYNGYIIIGNGTELQILDISDSQNPVIISKLVTDNEISDIAVIDHYIIKVYPFQIIDISDIFNPKVVWTDQSVSGSVLYYSGGYLYVGSNAGKIEIYDITNLTAPVKLGTMHLSGIGINSIAVREPYLYATSWDGWAVDIFNISNKNSPVYEGYYFIIGEGGALKIQTDYLYVGSYSYPQLRVLDISDPINPQLIGQLGMPDMPRFISTISHRDTTLYVSLSLGGFALVSVEDKNNPQLISLLDGDVTNHSNLICWKHTKIGNDFYISGFNYLWTLDLNGSGSLIEKNIIYTGGISLKIENKGDIAVIASGGAGVNIFNFSDPANPKMVGQFISNEHIWDMKIKENIAYLLGDSTLFTLDISDPHNPLLIYDTTLTSNQVYNPAHSLGLGNGLLFVVTGYDSIMIFDISNLVIPVHISTFVSLGKSVDLVVVDDILYSAEQAMGLAIYDIRNPNDPILVNVLSNYLSVLGLTTNVKELFSAAASGVVIYDIRNPREPIKLSYFNTSGPRETVELQTLDSLLYMAYGGNLEIINISKPDNPYSEAFLRGEAAYGLTLNDETILVSKGIDGVGLYKIGLLSGIQDDELYDEFNESILIYEPFPNPSNSFANLSFQVFQPTFISIKVFNVLGQKVDELYNGLLMTGKHILKFDLDRLSTGIYLIQIAYKNNIRVLKLVHLK